MAVNEVLGDQLGLYRAPAEALPPPGSPASHAVTAPRKRRST